MCIGCFTTQKELNKALEITIKKAEKYANEYNKETVVFQTFEGYDFMEKEAAIKDSQPYIRVIPVLQQTTN